MVKSACVLLFRRRTYLKKLDLLRQIDSLKICFDLELSHKELYGNTKEMEDTAPALEKLAV